MAIETGYFFITDITGYTQFLTHSELDHAKEILDALFDSILDNLAPPLIVSNTQGDAIIAYAPEQAFLHAQPLLDIMEKTYFAFRRQLELMDLNTTCDCNACINMNALDLKIFLHYGQYLLQEIGDKTDLQGSDVILAHRLMKNTVTKKTGWVGYGLLTAAAIEAMAIPGITEGMIEHVENYEHLGRVKVFIHDLRQAWKQERERNRLFVSAEDAAAIATTFLPIPPWIAWDYVSDMDIKLRFFELESIERTDSGGREGIGTSFHCAHRLGDIYYVYVDYDPPNYLSFEARSFGIMRLITLRIRPAEGGSIFEIYYGHPKDGQPEQGVISLQEVGDKTVARFAEIINEEIEAGNIKPNQLDESRALKTGFIRPAVSLGRFAGIRTKRSIS